MKSGWCETNNIRASIRHNLTSVRVALRWCIPRPISPVVRQFVFRTNSSCRPFCIKRVSTDSSRPRPSPNPLWRSPPMPPVATRINCLFRRSQQRVPSPVFWGPRTKLGNKTSHNSWSTFQLRKRTIWILKLFSAVAISLFCSKKKLPFF